VSVLVFPEQESATILQQEQTLAGTTKINFSVKPAVVAGFADTLQSFSSFEGSPIPVGHQEYVVLAVA
jgi:hypothetical protein